MIIESHRYKAVPAPNLTGIAELVAQDGERFAWIRWGGTTLSVMAEFWGPNEEEVRHQIVVNNADGDGRAFHFGTIERDGGHAIVTGQLSAQQSEELLALAALSIAAGRLSPGE